MPSIKSKIIIDFVTCNYVKDFFMLNYVTGLDLIKYLIEWTELWFIYGILSQVLKVVIN